MSEQIYTFEELREMIRPVIKRYNAESALLFGSYARRQATVSSDIDLLVIGGARFDPTDVFCIADDLYRLSGKNVDVYELCEIEKNSSFYNAVLEEGVSVT